MMYRQLINWWRSDAQSLQPVRDMAELADLIASRMADEQRDAKCNHRPRGVTEREAVAHLLVRLYAADVEMFAALGISNPLGANSRWQVVESDLAARVIRNLVQLMRAENSMWANNALTQAVVFLLPLAGFPRPQPAIYAPETLQAFFTEVAVALTRLLAMQ